MRLWKGFHRGLFLQRVYRRGELISRWIRRPIGITRETLPFSARQKGVADPSSAGKARETLEKAEAALGRGLPAAPGKVQESVPLRERINGIKYIPKFGQVLGKPISHFSLGRKATAAPGISPERMRTKSKSNGRFGFGLPGESYTGFRLPHWLGNLVKGIPVIGTAQWERMVTESRAEGMTGIPAAARTNGELNAGHNSPGISGGVWAWMDGSLLIIRQVESANRSGQRLTIQ